MIIGADTGGTFTDLVDDRGSIYKILSRPDDPGAPVAEGIATLSPSTPPDLLTHGTTVPTNALLEHKGARVALVTTAGFADVIEIARQDRPSLYDPFADRPAPLVPRQLRFEVGERLDARGQVVEPLDPNSIPAIPSGVETVAICLLHADLDDRHERAVAATLRERGLDVTCSADVSPEFREYERTVTTVANALLRPRCRAYLRSIGALASEVLVMTSAGGLVPADHAAELPVSLLLSGPAAGVQAAAVAAAACGFPDAVTFDMGGTSTDVCLVRGALPEPAPSLEVGGYPIRFPSLDIHSIGAGGGSIARVDAGGALRVGPESAGADPGPVCYGRGGRAPTVTDADLALGRIPPGSPLPGLGDLDVAASKQALEAAGLTPDGIVDVVDTNMVQAVRRVSVERGVDPRALALVAFGGAGPLHACAIAEALDMAAVVVPPRAGVLSAVGLLTSPRHREHVRSWRPDVGLEGLEQAREHLAAEAREASGGAAEVETFLDCRYVGQSHELIVRDVADFHEEHRRRNGFARPDADVEVVAVRARSVRPRPLEFDRLPRIEREPGRFGPGVVAEADCTVWIPDGWRARLHDTGAYVLHRESDG